MTRHNTNAPVVRVANTVALSYQSCVAKSHQSLFVSIAFVLELTAACSLGDSQTRYEQAGPIRYRALGSFKETILPVPRGCDEIELHYRFLGADEVAADSTELPMRLTFPFCQLPLTWRRALTETSPGGTVEYFVPKHIVPPRIARVILREADKDLRAVARIESVTSGNPRLTRPRYLTPPIEARTLPDGSRYLVVKEGAGEARVGPEDLLEIEQTFWQQDGTLLGSTVLLGRSNRLRVKDIQTPLRNLVGDSSEESRFLIWLPEGYGGYDSTIVLDATIVRVVIP